MLILEPNYSWAGELSERSETDAVILHHAAAENASPEAIHAAHLARGWRGIAYHYYVRKDGTVYRGRPENTIGGHTAGENFHTIGICFEGSFDTEIMRDEQLSAGRELLADIRARFPGIEIGAHRDYNATECPGSLFPFERMVDYMSGEEIYKNLTEYLRELPCPDWAEAEFSEAIAQGITDGTRPMELIPRYQAAIMAKRSAEKK